MNTKLLILTKNIASTTLRQTTGVFLGLLLSIFLARGLGPEGNGIYSLSILLPNLLANFFNLGLAPANVYFISRGDVSLQNAFKTNLGLGLFLSVIGTISGAIAILLFSDVFFLNIPSLLLWISVLTFPIILMQSFFLSLIQGIQDFKKFNRLLFFTPIVNLFIIVIIISSSNLNIKSALFSYIAAQTFSLVLIILSLKNYPVKIRHSLSFSEYIKKSIAYGWKAHLGNILVFINYRLDIFLVNFFLNPTSTGIYVVAVQIAERLWIVPSAVSTVLLPKLSELHNNETSRRSLTPFIARWILLITICFALIIALTSRFFIGFLFGNSYLNANTALLLLLPGVVCGSFSKILANDLAARGMPELNMYTACIIATINTILNILLIPDFGIYGASFATTSAYSINAVIKLYLYTEISGNYWWETTFVQSKDFKVIKETVRQYFFK